MLMEEKAECYLAFVLFHTAIQYALLGFKRYSCKRGPIYLNILLEPQVETMETIIRKCLFTVSYSGVQGIVDMGVLDIRP